MDLLVETCLDEEHAWRKKSKLLIHVKPYTVLMDFGLMSLYVQGNAEAYTFRVPQCV